jgi:hypothetical protein
MAERFKLERRRRPFERAWLWGGLSIAAGGAIGLGAYLDLRQIQRSGGQTSGRMFLLMSVLGVAAMALLSVTALYSLRKRRRGLQERTPGSMMAWLKSHIWLGWLALTVAVIHGLARPLPAGTTTGKVALWLLAALVLSGTLWRIAYLLIPPRVADRVGNLSREDTDERLRQTREAIDEAVAGASPALQAMVTDLLARRRARSRLEADSEALDDDDRAAWTEAVALVERRNRYQRRADTQRRLAMLLRGWRWLHLPLAGAVLGAIIVHILSVTGVVKIGTDGSVDGFASAAQCASCHVDIAEQWRLSMMAHSQLSPIDIAQTRLALQMDPRVGSFCVDCHAPIGAQLTGKDTLPLAAPGGASALSDGVSCAACHLVTGLPGVGRGAEPNYPINRSGGTSLGTVIGPQPGDPPPVPVPDHDTAIGFMGSDVGASRLCGACHVVEKDLNGDGNADDAQHDLVLQTTFYEWRQYLQDEGSAAQSCVSCHMVPQASGPLVQGPGLIAAPNRDIASHTFVGVDYDLAPGAYPPGGVQQVLDERASLLRQAVSMRVTTTTDADTLHAFVTITNVGAGHDFPTGFAFVRQFWLEVSATTQDGRAICLAPVQAGSVRIVSPCASGKIDSDQQDLAWCDPTQVPGDPNGDVRLTRPAPIGQCDPWLTSFQKILTDGDPTHSGVFREVAYQSLQPGIVRAEARVADGTLVQPIAAGASAKFEYDFDLSGVPKGSSAVVTASLRFRHLPPYFIRALANYYPAGLTPRMLLQNLVVTDVISASSPPARVRA